MKHPSRDQWAPFVFGESSPDTARTLNQHLAECAECRTEVETWRRTLKRLDSWQVAPRRGARRLALPLIPWAAAAAIVLGIGFALGRSAAVPAKTVASLEASIRASLQSELQDQLRSGVTSEVQRQMAQNQLASSNFVARFEARLMETRRAEAAELATEFASLLQEQDEHTRTMTEALLAKLQDEHQKDYVALRQDLEILASTADEQLQDTQSKLVLLSLAKGQDE